MCHDVSCSIGVWIPEFFRQRHSSQAFPIFEATARLIQGQAVTQHRPCGRIHLIPFVATVDFLAS